MRNNREHEGMVARDTVDVTEPPMMVITGLETMPAVQFAQFLPPHERDAIFNAVCTHQALFEPPGGPVDHTGGSLYLPLAEGGLDRKKLNEVDSACKALKKRILQCLPALFTALDVRPFPVSDVSLTLLNGMDGHCGSPHADDSGGRFQISLLYYFHQTPKAFSGGDLSFYKADPGSPMGHSDELIATLEHEDNLLLAFSSMLFHGVSDVRSRSTQFEDGRFVVVAFLGPE